MAVLINTIGAWLSLVERFVRDEEAVGSSPVTSTNTHNHFLIVSIFIAT